MMILRSTLAIAAVATVCAALGAPVPAEARRAPPRCKARVEGSGVGQGIAGVGSQKARISAKADWETRAHNRDGNEYASLDRATSVNWRCHSGALEAKCVVTARPCR